MDLDKIHETSTYQEKSKTKDTKKDEKKKPSKTLKEKKVTIINSTHDPEKFGNVDEHYEIEIFNEKRIIKKKGRGLIKTLRKRVNYDE